MALCIKNSVIATGSIGERIEIDRYIFFSFLTSGFIVPLGLAWCWNDGWLQNMGFIDYGGCAIVHVMGGLSGLIGTYLIGPRIGLFHSDSELNYIHSDEELIEKLKWEKETGHIDDDTDLAHSYLKGDHYNPTLERLK